MGLGPRVEAAVSLVYEIITCVDTKSFMSRTLLRKDFVHHILKGKNTFKLKCKNAQSKQEICQSRVGGKSGKYVKVKLGRQN